MGFLRWKMLVRLACTFIRVISSIKVMQCLHCIEFTQEHPKIFYLHLILRTARQEYYIVAYLLRRLLNRLGK